VTAQVISITVYILYLEGPSIITASSKAALLHSMSLSIRASQESCDA